MTFFDTKLPCSSVYFELPLVELLTLLVVVNGCHNKKALYMSLVSYWAFHFCVSNSFAHSLRFLHLDSGNQLSQHAVLMDFFITVLSTFREK